MAKWRFLGLRSVHGGAVNVYTLKEGMPYWAGIMTKDAQGGNLILCRVE